MFNRANPQPPNPPINVPYLFLYDPATNTMQPFCPLQEYTDSSQGSKKYYSHTDKRKREQLVRLVEEQGLSIKEASDRLGINYSTAKYIVKTFRETGSIETHQQVRKRPRPEGADQEEIKEEEEPEAKPRESRLNLPPLEFTEYLKED